MPLAVAIVEDHPDIRMGVSFILRSAKTVTVVGEYERAEDLIQEFARIKPDVVLMDIQLPGMSGIEATRILKNAHPRLEIVILSVLEDEDHLFQAICAGASGYVTKPVMPNQLLEAVEHAFTGGTPMSPLIARKVLRMFRENLPPPQSDYDLSPRELEVLHLLTEGASFGMIADTLFLSKYTVRAHVRNIYEKLHVHSKSEAVAKALKEKVLPPK